MTYSFAFGNLIRRVLTAYRPTNRLPRSNVVDIAVVEPNLLDEGVLIPLPGFFLGRVVVWLVGPGFEFAEGFP